MKIISSTFRVDAMLIHFSTTIKK